MENTYVGEYRCNYINQNKLNWLFKKILQGLVDLTLSFKLEQMSPCELWLVNYSKCVTLILTLEIWAHWKEEWVES